MKSTCQLRFEARKAQMDMKCQELNQKEQLEAMVERIRRARENRKQYVSSRRKMARDRVLRAQSIVRTIQLEEKRKSNGTLIRIQKRLEKAEKKRLEKLAHTTLTCKQRNNHILNTLQDLSKQSLEKRRLYEESLIAAHKRRNALTLAYTSKLSHHINQVELVKEHTLMIRNDAATRIQLQFRKFQRISYIYTTLIPLKSALDSILKLWHEIEISTFENSMDLLQNRKKIAKINFVAKHIFEGSTYRVLLMAGMLCHHPKDTMSQIYSPVLLFTANRLCQSLKSLAASMSSRIKFSVAWKRWTFLCKAYIDIFSQWKREDADRISADMLVCYSELYSIHQHAQREGNPQIIANSSQQLEQIRRAIVHALGTTAATQRIQEIEGRMTRNNTPPAIPAAPKSRVSSKPDLDFTKSVFSNDILAHELILNPSFRLPKESSIEIGSLTKSSPLEQRLQQAMQQAFWDKLRESNDREWIVRMTLELRDTLAQVARSDEAVLMTNVTKENLELMSKSASWTDWVETMKLLLITIKKNEAPARNESTDELLHQITSMAAPTTESTWFDMLSKFLRFGVEKIDQIRLDSLNAHLSLIAPYLARHGVEHEAKKFSQKIESGELILTNTAAWIQGNLERVDHQSKMELYHGHAEATRSFLRNSFISLIENIQDPDKELWPETLSMDKSRIISWRNQLDSIALQASFVALIREACGMHGVQYSTSNASAFCATISILSSESNIKLADLVAQVIHEITQQLVGKEWSTESRISFTNRIDAVVHASNPIFKLFFQRALNVVREYLIITTLKCPSSMELFSSELQVISTQMAKFSQHNEAVHATYYNRLLHDTLH